MQIDNSRSRQPVNRRKPGQSIPPVKQAERLRKPEDGNSRIDQELTALRRAQQKGFREDASHHARKNGKRKTSEKKGRDKKRLRDQAPLDLTAPKRRKIERGSLSKCAEEREGDVDQVHGVKK